MSSPTCNAEPRIHGLPDRQALRVHRQAATPFRAQRVQKGQEGAWIGLGTISCSTRAQGTDPGPRPPLAHRMHLQVQAPPLVSSLPPLRLVHRSLGKCHLVTYHVAGRDLGIASPKCLRFDAQSVKTGRRQGCARGGEAGGLFLKHRHKRLDRRLLGKCWRLAKRLQGSRGQLKAVGKELTSTLKGGAGTPPGGEEGVDDVPDPSFICSATRRSWRPLPRSLPGSQGYR